ncbi:hypothetical protein QUF79_00080 [Fictibacillus enclensis]|uniref:hypothetical protein n=1 Tax=Fictibacillus enclensis TaxID=1017270 RepID=UPI0025A2996B|nr:hypothetical protein [Fictibacillus enclensis]MDM5196498.1 hypothetical protein [Fictibacillus enclensis]
MLQVVFTEFNDNSIKKFERIDFVEAVKQTMILEQKYREEKKMISGSFYLIESENDSTALYTGTFKFGSRYAPNLYIHIKKKLEEIKMNRQQQRDRIELIAKMEDGLPEIYKKEEVIENAHLLNLNVSRISRLKKWQRRSIYALTGLLGLGLIGTIFYMVMIVAQYDVAYSKEQNKVAAQNKQLDIYEQGLLGKHDVLLDYFKATKTNLSDEEKKIYANLLLKDKKYKELVSLYNNDSGYIATMISKQGDINALRAFHKDFPSNESTFDLLYADKKYKELLAVKDVDMTVKRSEMKTYALMKTGKIEEANAELANNNNKDLKAKITQYEKLSKELKEFNEAIKVAKDSKKAKEVKALSKKKTDLEKQFNAI